MTRNERILEELKKAGKSQADLAAKLGVSRAAVSERLNNEKAIDSFEFLLAVSELTGTDMSFLYQGIEFKEKLIEQVQEIRSRLPLVQEKSEVDQYLKGTVVRPITVTVDRQGKELVSYVPVKAQAGYMRGYADPHYIEKLPAFSLPALSKENTYRMFEVDGPSMQQLGGKGLRQGDIIIAQYVEDILALKDNLVYVVVSTEGVAIKRVINRLKNMDDPMLIMTSDNKNGDHPTYSLKPKEIKEVWMARRVISSDFSFDTDLFQMLGDIQHEQLKMKEEIKQLKGK